MKQVGLMVVVMLLGVSLSWGQTNGVMPKRSASLGLPSQRLLEKRDQTPVEVLPIDTAVVYHSSEEILEAVKSIEQPTFDVEAVDMFGFDKRMSDTQESFLLRNNTPYHLSRVVIKLIYRTLDDHMIDYQERVVECDLLPGSTRRCEVPSFDTSRNYYHVDSPPARTSGRPFKVSFQLLRYDVVVEP